MATGMTYSVALEGIAGQVVSIEADVHHGLPSWSLSGLPDASVAEARDRCRAALVNSGQAWPDMRVTVAMYPADVRKVGSHYDLAIALALMLAQGQVEATVLRSVVIFGELGLDGRLRSVPGVLPALLTARDAGLDRAIVPASNASEARLVPGIDIRAVDSLAECLAILTGQEPPTPVVGAAHVPVGPSAEPHEAPPADLADVFGQADARWALEVAAAGGHHVFLDGPPGVGKTMLAERLPGLLPDLGVEDAIEVTTIHSLAGRVSRDDPLVRRPPFLAPHHRDTAASVVGGGSKVIRPGAISLAHRGVLFLDEAPEFAPSVHDALRQPLESGQIAISRAGGAVTFPARFQLVLAANPCPCGQNFVGGTCVCDVPRQRRYRARISGPMRDRIDIARQVLPARLQADELAPGEATSVVAGRVAEARLRAAARLGDLPWRTNAGVPGHEMQRRCPLPDVPAAVLDRTVRTGQLSHRGADRVRRLAWTLADLAGRDRPVVDDVYDGLFLRDAEVFAQRPSAAPEAVRL